MNRYSRAAGWIGFLGLACRLHAQTVQGLISGDVVSLYDGSALAGARVMLSRPETLTRPETTSDPQGRFGFASLSPGVYQLRVEKDTYQAQEAHGLVLSVAGTLKLVFRLRPMSDLRDDSVRNSLLLPRSVLPYFGPDVDSTRVGNFEGNRGLPGALEISLSQVIDGRWLSDLPLAGRDAYTLLITQPGVTADTTTTRSLGLSVNGQRPSASLFLLDGIENNNALATGPLTPLPPEALQEYRISTSVYSAEYGKTSGILANAVTRSGTTAWHGLLYGYWKPTGLLARGPLPGPVTVDHQREMQPGFSGGGPLRKTGLFASLSAELFRFRSRGAPLTFTLPSEQLLAMLPAQSLAGQWLARFPGLLAPAAGLTGAVIIAPPVTVNRELLLQRTDWAPAAGKQRVSARVAWSRLHRPDLVYSPYPDFLLPLRRESPSLAVNWVRMSRASRTDEIRVGASRDDFSAMRPHPEIPALAVTLSAPRVGGVALPGSSVSYSFANRTSAAEAGYSATHATGRHVTKFGAGYTLRRIGGYLNAYGAGRYVFDSLEDLANDAPASAVLSVARAEPLAPVLPDFDRRYRVQEWFGFAQDSFRVSSRLTLSYGLRYDLFLPAFNSGGQQDLMLQLGSADSLPEQIRRATFAPARSLVEADKNDFASRIGVSWSVDRGSTTVLRASYGQFYDRPFDNIWQTVRNNSYQHVVTALPPERRDYSNPAAVLRSLPNLPTPWEFPEVTWLPQGLRTPLVHSGFAGIQHSVRGSLFLEAVFLMSRGQGLIATDRWNRQTSEEPSLLNRSGRYNPALPDIIARGNWGRSSYRGFAALARHSDRRGIWQVSYTLGSSRDNQSDPIAGEFLNLGFGGGPQSPNAGFIRQFDSGADWGHSDFDQRHNVVFFAARDLPGLLHRWRLGLLGAVRSGFPFTATASSFEDNLRHNPLDVVAPDRLRSPGVPEGNGVRLLNSDAFAAAPPGRVGNLGRNNLYGPGLLSLDTSLSRRFRARLLGEAGEVAFRVDAFNLLNHSNLNNPETRFESPDFGVATRGREQRPNAFRLLGPGGETARQIQIGLRIAF